MSGLYLETPSGMLGVVGNPSRPLLSKWITDLLLEDDWVKLGSNFGGILAEWTVMARDDHGVPDVVAFAACNGTTELLDVNAPA